MPCRDSSRHPNPSKIKQTKGASFNYSDALKNAHITWDANSLDKWLAGPDDQLIPDNDMPFHVESAAERSEIIAYLKQMR